MKPSRLAWPFLVAALALGCGPAAAPPPRPPASAPAPGPVAQLQQEARAVAPLVESGLARAFLAATAGLPRVAPRVVWHDEGKTRYYSEAQQQGLPEAQRRGLRSRTLDEEYYYTTKYGTPLAYSRPLDLLARTGLHDVAGARILDFGYGGIGHLRLLASLGARVTGVDVDPLLPALYSAAGDQGPVAGAGTTGRVTLAHGRWPAEAGVRAAVGEGYDLVISKNTLKRGYLHPERPVEERKRIRLGVDDATFVRELYRILKPGGRLLIYNLCPAPAPPDKPYIPWADGRSPFTREAWQEAGFRVLVFDRDDTAAARAMGRALGWDRGEDRMDLERDLFAWYTLLEKPAGAPGAGAPTPAVPEPRLTLRPPLSAPPLVVVAITAKAVTVTVHARGPAPKVLESLPRRAGAAPYDYAALNRVLAKLVRARWPDPAKRPAETQQITVAADPDTTYETVVKVMDAARAVLPGPGVTDAGRVLFPDVILGAAP